MKVSIGMKLLSGPTGGGNQAVGAICDYLREQGDTVVHDLDHPDIDVVMMTEPRRKRPSSAFGGRDVARFRRRSRRSKRAVVVHRVNECDERKLTTDVNRELRKWNRVADHTVFISAWLRDLHIGQGMRATPNSVIHNGADRRVFHMDGASEWEPGQKLRLVTHHWSAHRRKGADVYEALDRALGGPLGEQVAFTWVGNLPEDTRLQHSRHVAPLSGKPLADALRSHHAYVTASLCEPGGNHQHEGACCGLPVLYIENGGIHEQSRGYGVGFMPDDFFDRL
ncbi:MAG: hypothetical protein AB7S36_13690, partial [Planctomycetota bacterium]